VRKKYENSNSDIGIITHPQGLKRSCRIGDCNAHFVEAGVDLVTLAAMLGHSRIQMVLRYAHPTEEHRRLAALSGG